MEKDIYKLKLHEHVESDDWQATRVAGGWIYRFWNYTKQDWYASSIFIPYNDEFYKGNK